MVTQPAKSAFFPSPQTFAEKEKNAASLFFINNFLQ